MKKPKYKTKLITNSSDESDVTASADYEADDYDEDAEYYNPDDEKFAEYEKFTTKSDHQKLNEIKSKIADEDFVENIIEYLDLKDLDCWHYLLEFALEHNIDDVISKFLEVRAGSIEVFLAVQNKNLGADGMDSLLRFCKKPQRLNQLLMYLPQNIESKLAKKVADFIVDIAYHENLGCGSTAEYKILMYVMQRFEIGSDYWDLKDCNEYLTEMLECLPDILYDLTVLEVFEILVLTYSHTIKFGFSDLSEVFSRLKLFHPPKLK